MTSTPGPQAKVATSTLGKVLRIAICAAIVVGLGLTFRRLDVRALGQALARSRPAPLVLASLLVVGQVLCRGLVFRTLMLPVVRLPWIRALRYTVAGFATSSVAPGRAGDFLRMHLLKRDGNVPYSATAATLVVDKLLDVVAMFIVVAPAPWLIPSLPPWVVPSVLVVAALVTAVAVLALVLASRPRPPRWLAGFHAGVAVIRRPSLLVWSVVLGVASWTLDFSCICVVMGAVGVALPAAAAMLVLLSVNLALSVPAMPANVGVVEFSVMVVLRPLGVPAELGLAVGLVYHLVQVLPVATLALIDSRFVASARPVETGPE
jgi:glycosyltransferase 2 family protein